MNKKTQIELSNWGVWIIKTTAIGGMICLIPTPISFDMKIGVLSIIVAALIVQSGSEKTAEAITSHGKELGKEIGSGLKYLGISVGLAIGVGLISLAFAVGRDKSTHPTK